MTSLQTYIDDIKSSGLPVLGNVLWYSVTEHTRISHEDMAKRLEDAGLGAFTPAMPRDDDTFLRVTSDIGCRRQPIAGTDLFENILVRKISHAKGHIVKQIVAERVDAENRKLSYEAVVELEFSPKRGFTFRPINGHIHGRAIEMARNAKTGFTSWQGHLHSDAVRTVISKVIHSTHALLVKPTGGVYFAADQHTPTIQALINAIDGIHGVHVDPVPLIDSQNQREMLRRAFEEDAVKEMISITEEINKLTAAGSVTPGQKNAITDRISSVMSKANEFEEILSGVLQGAELHTQAMNSARRRLQMS